MDADRLLTRIVAHPDPKSLRVGALSNRLLKEFKRGYPLEKLRPLLRSEDLGLVNIAVWIASELGESGRALFDDVSRLLSHPAKGARYWAIDCMLIWATPSNKSELASVISLLDDSEPTVRWKAMDFVSRASPEQLQAALFRLQSTQPQSSHVQGLKWLLGPDASNPESVKASLRSSDALIRKYAVIAARRLSKENSEALYYASSTEDGDVKNFANSSIKLL